MKKLVLALVLLTAAGLAAVSVWASLRVKQAYRELILAIAESPDTRIIDTGYQRGWLQSTSHASVEIRGLLGESFQSWLHAVGHEEVRGRVGIRLEQTVEHGYRPLRDWLAGGAEGAPVVARLETHLELDKETQSEVAMVLGRLPSVSISTAIRISGVGESFVVIPAKRLESRPAEEGGPKVRSAEFEGLHGHVVYTTDLQHFAASFSSAGIEGGDAETVFALRDLEWAADVRRDGSGLLVGELSSSVASFRLAPSDGVAPALELEGFAVRQTNSVEAGRFASALDLGVREIRLGEQSFGPGEAGLRLRNVDAASLARVQSHGVAGFTAPEPRGARPAAEAGPRGVLASLLSRSPQLEIQQLRLATPSGEVRAKLRIDIDGSRPELLYSLQSLPGQLRVEAEVDCPAAILDELYRGREGELEELRDQGWLLLDGERYRSGLLLDRGDLLVNGLSRSLDELFGTPPDELPQLSAVDSASEGAAPGPELLP